MNKKEITITISCALGIMCGGLIMFASGFNESVIFNEMAILFNGVLLGWWIFRE